MSGNTLAKWIAVVATGFAASACIAQNRGDGLVQVNEFMAMVERVHTDSELASQKVHATSAQFAVVLTFNFTKDPVAVYKEFSTAVDASGKQLLQMRLGIDAMKRSADPVFRKWAADLDTFASMEMRLRSQQRLLETRKRYDAIVAAVDPAQMAYEAFDKKMRDYATFLAHDFNEASIAALRADQRPVKEMTAALDRNFDSCQLAARDYVQASGMPTTTPAPEPAAQKTPPKKAAARSDG